MNHSNMENICDTLTLPEMMSADEEYNNSLKEGSLCEDNPTDYSGFSQADFDFIDNYDNIRG